MPAGRPCRSPRHTPAALRIWPRCNCRRWPGRRWPSSAFPSALAARQAVRAGTACAAALALSDTIDDLRDGTAGGPRHHRNQPGRSVSRTSRRWPMPVWRFRWSCCAALPRGPDCRRRVSRRLLEALARHRRRSRVSFRGRRQRVSGRLDRRDRLERVGARRPRHAVGALADSEHRMAAAWRTRLTQICIKCPRRPI